jgi:hypothetical protein
VRVHVYPDGSHALFHGPRCIGRYDEKGPSRKPDAPLRLRPSPREFGVAFALRNP